MSDITTSEAIISLLIRGSEIAVQAARDLRADDFTDETHKIVFRAIYGLQSSKIAVDHVTVGHRLSNTGELKSVGGQPALIKLAALPVDETNVQGYVDCVKSDALKRRQIAAAGNLAAEINAGGDVTGAMQSLQNSMISAKSTGFYAKDLLVEFFKTMKNKRPGILTGIPTGIDDLDQITNGLQPGNLIIIAARPSMGKTTLAINIAAHAAKLKGSEQFPALVFSLEMSQEELIQKIMSAESQVYLSKIQRNDIDDKNFERIKTATVVINDMRLVIDDTGALTITELQSRARRRVQEDGIKLIVVDYLQLIRAENSRDSREQEVASISAALKALAKELKIPVIALSQLNRDLEKRADKRPTISDLRESGAIEQDADIAMFLYREAVYCDDCKSARTTGIACTKGHSNNAELIIGKFRSGELGNIPLDFDWATQRFLNKGALAAENEVEAIKHERAPHPTEMLINQPEICQGLLTQGVYNGNF